MKYPHLYLFFLFVSQYSFSQELSFENISIESDCVLSSISINVTGGLAPYDYIWSNGATGDYIDNLTEGIYSITVTDSNNATIDTSLIINSELIADSYSYNTSCHDNSDGEIIVDLYEGTPPFNYYLYQNSSLVEDSGYTVDSTYTFQNIQAGEYDVCVSDFNGCTSCESENILNPDSFYVNIDEIIFFEGDSVQLTHNSNFVIDSFQWSPNIDISCLNCPNPFVFSSEDICYSLEVWNQNNCYTSDEICIELITSIIEIDLENIKINPNPFTDYLEVNIDTKESITVELFNVLGKKVFQSNSKFNFIETVTFEKGLYFLSISTENNTFIHQIIHF